MFRAPANGSLLAVYVGTGVQLLGMSIVTMLFAVLGFLSPANRGGLMTAMLLIYVFMGVVGGYFSARLYKSFKVRARPVACGTQLCAQCALSCVAASPDICSCEQPAHCQAALGAVTPGWCGPG